jgi:hypothetical protein
VVTVRSNWLTGLRISTVAFGTTAPLGSNTVPVTAVEFPADCAWTLRPIKKKEMIKKAAQSDFL